jgi:hypothetical protein
MLNLFFGGEQFKTNFGNDFGNIELDATLEEGHEWNADVTTNPVEIGADITDHVIEQPDRVSIRGVVSDTPLNGIIGNIVSFINSLTGAEQRSQAVFDLLHELIKLKQPMTIVTKYHIYTDMVLASVNIPRNSGTGEAIEFNAEFVNIRLVSTQTVDVPDGISAKKNAKGDAATSKKTEPAKNQGKVQGKNPSEKQSVSILESARRSAFGA